jgi:hypothetical protein
LILTTVPIETPASAAVAVVPTPFRSNFLAAASFSAGTDGRPSLAPAASAFRMPSVVGRLFMVAPTTVAGVAAWLTHLAEPEHPGGRSIAASIGEYYDTDFHAAVVQQFLNAAAVLRREQPAA